jgi:hypothetical protein
LAAIIAEDLRRNFPDNEGLIMNEAIAVACGLNSTILTPVVQKRVMELLSMVANEEEN